MILVTRETIFSGKKTYKMYVTLPCLLKTEQYVHCTHLELSALYYSTAYITWSTNSTGQYASVHTSHFCSVLQYSLYHKVGQQDRAVQRVADLVCTHQMLLWTACTRIILTLHLSAHRQSLKIHHGGMWIWKINMTSKKCG